jgi:hypothetical protein
MLQALQKNVYTTEHWMKLRDEYVTLHSHLGILPDKLSHEVMVPIGSKALMRGKMLHTNEILVCLGDGWFVKCSAKEAAEICDRRIKCKITVYMNPVLVLLKLNLSWCHALHFLSCLTSLSHSKHRGKQQKYNATLKMF